MFSSPMMGLGGSIATGGLIGTSMIVSAPAVSTSRSGGAGPDSRSTWIGHTKKPKLQQQQIEILDLLPDIEQMEQIETFPTIGDVAILQERIEQLESEINGLKARLQSIEQTGFQKDAWMIKLDALIAQQNELIRQQQLQLPTLPTATMHPALLVGTVAVVALVIFGNILIVSAIVPILQ